jgi:hypothetical protein
VQSKLNGMGAFAQVDIFANAVYGGSQAFIAPTASQLAAYHAVLVYSIYRLPEPGVLGDRLAAFHDQGGGVVVAFRANNDDSPEARLQGAYGTPEQGYALLDYAQGYSTQDSDPGGLGVVLEAQSPLMAGVASFDSSPATRSTSPPIAGRAVVVARWRGGGEEPLVLRGTRGNRTLVELNFWPLPGVWTGDGAPLMRNALKFSRCMLCAKGTYGVAGVPFAHGCSLRPLPRSSVSLTVSTLCPGPLFSVSSLFLHLFFLLPPHTLSYIFLSLFPF